MRDWADLPEELLRLIQSNLFATDRHNFGLVCRSWNAVAAGWPYALSPCLIFCQGSKQGFFQYNSFSHMSFPELDNAHIYCSKYGWLLMCRDHDRSLFFFEPFTRQTIELPASDRSYTTIYFSDPPTSPDCIIVGIAGSSQFFGVEIGLLRRRDDGWDRYAYEDEFYVSMALPVLHCGLLWFLDLKGNLATFDIHGHGYKSSWKVYTKCLESRRIRWRSTQHFLFRIKGEEALSAVVLDDRRVNLLRLSEPEMKWKTVKDLGDKVLYLSHASSFGGPARLKSMANKIYLPKFHDDNVVYYSLDTRKYHSFGDGDYSSYDSNSLRRFNFAAWITPPPTRDVSTELTWRLEGDDTDSETDYSKESDEVDDSEVDDTEVYESEVYNSKVDDAEVYD